MSTQPTAMIRPFSEGTPYTQDEPPGATFAWLLEQDEVPGLAMGLVKLEGPIHKTPAAHSEWEQVYLIFSGSGTVHLGEQSRDVRGPAVVVIPKHTRHSVQLEAGETMQYVFVNQYR